MTADKKPIVGERGLTSQGSPSWGGGHQRDTSALPQLAKMEPVAPLMAAEDQTNANTLSLQELALANFASALARRAGRKSEATLAPRTSFNLIGGLIGTTG